jgi:hypothetical protein
MFAESIEHFIEGSPTDWWNGLVLLDQYAPNRFDFKTISIDQLKARYA